MRYLHEQCPANIRGDIVTLELAHVHNLNPGHTWYTEHAVKVLYDVVCQNIDSVNPAVVKWLFTQLSALDTTHQRPNPKAEQRAEGHKLSRKREHGSHKHGRQVAHHHRQNAEMKRKQEKIDKKAKKKA